MDRSYLGVRGFEPPTPSSQNWCSSQAELHPDNKKSVRYILKPARARVSTAQAVEPKNSGSGQVLS